MYSVYIVLCLFPASLDCLFHVVLLLYHVSFPPWGSVRAYLTVPISLYVFIAHAPLHPVSLPRCDCYTQDNSQLPRLRFAHCVGAEGKKTHFFFVVWCFEMGSEMETLVQCVRAWACQGA